MLLHFLQQRDPPVLPVLQELYDTKEKPENIVEGFNCWFYDDLNNLVSCFLSIIFKMLTLFLINLAAVASWFDWLQQLVVFGFYIQVYSKNGHGI